MNTNIIAQPAAAVQDGVHWSEEFNEYEIVINGDPVAWASTQGQAWRSYHEMLRVDREHRARGNGRGGR